MLMLTGFLPGDPKKITAYHMLALILIQAAIFLGITIALAVKLKLPFFGQGDEVTFKDLTLGLAGLMLVNILNSAYLQIMGMQPDQFKEFSTELLTSNIYLFMFTVALIGPVYEEIIFRGYMLGMLVIRNVKSADTGEDSGNSQESQISKNVIPILFTSLLFMLAHFDDISGNYLIGLPWFFLGVYFALWAIYKKGIMLTILLHVSQNLMAGMAMIYALKHT